MKSVTMSCGAALAALLIACGSPGTASRQPAPGADLGIEVAGVQLMADGDLARLTYRVVDYETARRSLSAPAALYPAGGGAPLAVMQAGRLGPLRQRPSATGKPQFMLFTNAGRVLRKGETAVLRIGEVRIDGIPIS